VTWACFLCWLLRLGKHSHSVAYPCVTYVTVQPENRAGLVVPAIKPRRRGSYGEKKPSAAVSETVARPNWPTRQFASRDVGNSRRHPFGARSVTPPSVLKSGLARVAVPEQVAGSLARGPCRSAAGYGRGRRILSSAHPLISRELLTMAYYLDLTGNSYGRLYVVGMSDKQLDRNERRARPCWSVICDCGNYHIVRGRSLPDGSTKSCGCIVQELARVCVFW
jgi:hypothetical protein